MKILTKLKWQFIKSGNMENANINQRDREDKSIRPVVFKHNILSNSLGIILLILNEIHWFDIEIFIDKKIGGILWCAPKVAYCYCYTNFLLFFDWFYFFVYSLVNFTNNGCEKSFLSFITSLELADLNCNR